MEIPRRWLKQLWLANRESCSHRAQCPRCDWTRLSLTWMNMADRTTGAIHHHRHQPLVTNYANNHNSVTNYANSAHFARHHDSVIALNTDCQDTLYYHILHYIPSHYVVWYCNLRFIIITSQRELQSHLFNNIVGTRKPAFLIIATIRALYLPITYWDVFKPSS